MKQYASSALANYVSQLILSGNDAEHIIHSTYC